jgi:hypothetical protein
MPLKSPEVWGPKAWEFLNCIVFSYPENNPGQIKQQETIQFFNSLGSVLPCEICGNDYKNFITQNPIESKAGNREDLSRWLYNIRTLIDNKLNIPFSKRMSYNDLKLKYESCNLTSIKPFRFDIIYVLIICILSIILLRSTIFKKNTLYRPLRYR